VDAFFEDNKIPKKAFCRKYGLGEATVFDLGRGKSAMPRIDTVGVLASGIGFSIDELVGLPAATVRAETVDVDALTAALVAAHDAADAMYEDNQAPPVEITEKDVAATAADIYQRRVGGTCTVDEVPIVAARSLSRILLRRHLPSEQNDLLETG